MNACGIVLFAIFAWGVLTDLIEAKFYMEYRNIVDKNGVGQQQSNYVIHECEGYPSEPAITAAKVLCTGLNNLYRKKMIHDTINFYLVYKPAVVTTQKLVFSDLFCDRLQSIPWVNIGVVGDALDGPCFTEDPVLAGERLTYFKERAAIMITASNLDHTPKHLDNLARFYAQTSAVSLAKDDKLAPELFSTFAFVLDQMTTVYINAELVRRRDRRKVTANVPEMSKKQFLEAVTMALRKMIDPCSIPSLSLDQRSYAASRYCVLYCRFLGHVYAMYGWNHLKRCSSLDWARCENRMCYCFRNLGFPFVGWLWRPKVSMVSCANGFRFKLRI